jgi:hypothetical protein
LTTRSGDALDVGADSEETVMTHLPAQSPDEALGYDWKELMRRDGDGLVVRLEWSRSLTTVRIAVTDLRAGQQFEVDVADDEALAAFRHPFVYAAGHGTSSDALRASLGLAGQPNEEASQLQ